MNFQLYDIITFISIVYKLNIGHHISYIDRNFNTNINIYFTRLLTIPSIQVRICSVLTVYELKSKLNNIVFIFATRKFAIFINYRA